MYNNNIAEYTMTIYRKMLATKAQHSSHSFGHMFRAENLVFNFISASISVQTAVRHKQSHKETISNHRELWYYNLKIGSHTKAWIPLTIYDIKLIRPPSTPISRQLIPGYPLPTYYRFQSICHHHQHHLVQQTETEMTI